MTRLPAPALLPDLLWTVLSGLESVYIRCGAGEGSIPTLDLWANLLRVVGETGTCLQDLPSIVCLSKRALRPRIEAAIRRGWINEFNMAEGRAVRLTTPGSELANLWRSLQERAEKQWQSTAGVETTAHLHHSLVRIVAAFPLEHPHYPASYGPADASITGGNGTDWKEVRRTDRGAVGVLPLSALLSQAIVAFAMAYEKQSPVALSLSASIIRRIPLEGQNIRELANRAGLSALARHGFLSFHGTGRNRHVLLTAKGIAVKNAFEERVRSIEMAWSDSFGSNSVPALCRALDAVISRLSPVLPYAVRFPHADG
jgi:hypothetical protein